MRIRSFSLFRDAVRAKEIVAILFKYRFDEILEKVDTPASWLTKLAPAIKGNYTLWQRIRLAIEELGPTFVKMGQILSTRPDVLPRELIVELEKLRSRVKPVPFAEIKPVLEGELANPIGEVFAEFEEEPVAAASIAQIYRARLGDTGQVVAVKVQRPGIQKQVQTDLEILAWFADELHEKFSALRPFDLPSVVEELKKGINNELNFRIEARNAALFNSLNQHPERVFAPAVVERFRSSRILVTEWIDGKPPEASEFPPEEAAELARTGGDSFFSQIVVTGFFHGDPHPGNIFITPDNRICFIDWGLAGQLTRQMRYNLIDLFAACNERDAAKVAQIAMRMGRTNRRIDRLTLEKAVTTVLFKYDEDLKNMDNLGHVIFELIFVFGSNGVHVTRDYTLLAKAIISIENTSTRLDPHFNLATVGKPYIRKLNWERWNPTNVVRSGLSGLRERIETFSELPGDLQRVLHRLEDEEIGILLEHRGFGQVGETIHSAFSRLALSVIIAALIIGSSIVITTGIGPNLWGFPAIGVVGYLLSAVFGVYVAFDILRSHKVKERPRKKRPNS